MNHQFCNWDEVSGEVTEFTLPADGQQAMAAIWPVAKGKVILDLADVWHAEEIKCDVGYERTHITLDDGTYVLSAVWGRDKQYAIAWHPQDQTKARDALLALQMEGEGDEDDQEERRLLPLAQEVAKKLAEAIKS